MISPYLKSPSKVSPRLRHEISFLNLVDLPEWSEGPKGSDEEKLAVIKAAGFEGVEGADAPLAKDAGLIPSALGNVQAPDVVEKAIAEQKELGYEYLVLHVGSGLESDSKAELLLSEIIKQSERYDLPTFVETHRSTITQDMRRAVEIVESHPTLRLVADFSHWYTGLEMPNGDWDFKMNFIKPVFERANVVHGRIGNAGHIQINIGDGKSLPCVDHYRDMWIRTFEAFLRSAEPGDVLPFCPELLWSAINYARVIPGPDGELREESDRWQQALVLRRIADECFEQARTNVESTLENVAAK